MGFIQGAQSGQIGGVSANPSLAFVTQNTAPGNLLIAIISLFGADLNSVTDSQGNTYTISSDFLSTYHFYFAYALNTVGGTIPTVTFHCSGTPGNACAAVGEYSGVNAFRAISANATGTSNTPTSSNISVIAGDLLIGFAQAVGNTGFAQGAGYIIREQGNIHINRQNAFEDAVAASTGNTNASFTFSPSDAWSAGIIAFIPAFSISGSAGTAGATVSWSGTASGSTTADGSGNYTIPGLANGNYTVTPSKTGFTFSPVSSNQTVAGANITGVNFVATPVLTVYSVPDCRVAPFGPNSSRTVQGTKIYDVQISDNASVPGKDSRSSVPADSRVSPNIPQNSRAPGTFGPGE